MAIILWILLIWICFWLFFRVIFRGYRLYRQSRNMFNQFFGAQESDPDKGKRKKEPSEPQQPPKKIDASVGEYVHFEEIEITTEQTHTVDSDGIERTTTKTVVEEQVVDVEWEELP